MLMSLLEFGLAQSGQNEGFSFVREYERPFK